MGVASTLGAVLAGTFFSIAFSGFIALQTFMYFRKYPNDPFRQKLLAFFLWSTDATQSILIAISTWEYVIVNFGNPAIGGHVFITTAIAIWFTALMTTGANLFYCGRIHRLSTGNWWITGPILFLTISRLATATTTSIELCILKSVPVYSEHFKPLWTTGLANAAVTDMLVTAALCYYLQSHDPVLSSTERMIRLIVVLTINNGALTSAMSIICLVCWMTMPNNLIFLAFYMLIGKLYAMSLLATFNMRNWIRERSTPTQPRNLVITTGGCHAVERSNLSMSEFAAGSITASPFDDRTLPKRLEVNVRKSVQFGIEAVGDGSLSSSSTAPPPV
ncbi:hypothetical protein BV25DRAFT_1821000 [Artomyces pyxidatus]|uniref:Uncharacterized protein n=1 Tax=Artomyces pyxidatus TaxID=48021 RepID=A0ACB8TCU8_9AGAM|nr:hypothetical protein BV25DRAFT_1821000 [Artomyces pyxidatus]